MKEVHVESRDPLAKVPTDANAERDTTDDDEKGKLQVVKTDRKISITKRFEPRYLIALRRHQPRQH